MFNASSNSWSVLLYAPNLKVSLNEAAEELNVVPVGGP